MLSVGADDAVRLQAAHVMRTLLRGLTDEDDLAVFTPHAPHALLGLAAALGGAGGEEGVIWRLRAVRTVAARFSEAAARADVQAALGAALSAEWARAKAAGRRMLLRELRRAGAAMEGAAAAAAAYA